MAADGMVSARQPTVRALLGKMADQRRDVVAALRPSAPVPRVLGTEKCATSRMPEFPCCCPRQFGPHRIGRNAGTQCVVLLPKVRNWACPGSS